MAKTKTLSIFVSMIKGLVYKLDMQYWVTHCGNDGYLYLLFQRNIFILMIQLSLISFVMSIAMNLFIQDNRNKSLNGDVVLAWLDHTTLDNKELSNFRGWFHTTMVFIFTFLTIYNV